MIRFILLLFLFKFLLIQNLFAKNLEFTGLSRLNLDDVNILSSINIFKNDFSESEINQIIKDLYNSDQILNAQLSNTNKSYVINIDESPIIENIYINGNIFIKDEDLLTLLDSKKNAFLNKKLLNEDINKILNIYLARGFEDVFVTSSIEKFSKSKINLIIQINEGKQYKLKNINFYGNSFFSDNYLLSLINSKSVNFYNIFSNGSNLNKAIFENDKYLLEDFYKKKGYFDVKISYLLNKGLLGFYVLNFYLEENSRSKIQEIQYKIDSDLLQNLEVNNLINDFEKRLLKNDNFYDYEIINKFIESVNLLLIKNNLNKEISFKTYYSNNDFILEFESNKSDLKIINDILIYGNSITRNNVLMSKIDYSPGDYLSNYKLNSTKEKLERLKYINKVSISTKTSNDLIDVIYDIDENKKTGNFGFGVAFNGDTGGGVVFNIKDSNIFGSGNEIEGDFNLNSEVIKFDLSFVQNPLTNSNYANKYSIRSKELDYQSTYGYKTTEKSISYDLLFKYSSSISTSIGYSLSNQLGHSAIDSNDIAITDSIGDFTDSIFNISLFQDNTNNYLYPNDGYKNNFTLFYSPDGLSDNAYIKAIFRNDIFYKIKNSENYFFISNNFGAVESLDSKRINTSNSFSLGGLNFKGFDFRGIGTKNSNNIYLGGNKYITSTVGYGTSFLFDQKDNMYLRYFYTLGSLWDSDYEDNNFNIRTSAGLSFDILSPIGPVSFTYAIPINKVSTDRLRSFNFSIGTAF